MPGLAANRLAKARRFADFIEARRLADVVESYSPEEWTELAAQAEEAVPSLETIEVVLSVLADRAQVRAEALAVLKGVLNGGSMEWHEATLYLDANHRRVTPDR